MSSPPGDLVLLEQGQQRMFGLFVAFGPDEGHDFGPFAWSPNVHCQTPCESAVSSTWYAHLQLASHAENKLSYCARRGPLRLRHFSVTRLKHKPICRGLRWRSF